MTAVVVAQIPFADLTSRWSLQWYPIALALIIPIVLLAVTDRLTRERR